jgi:hypothetical protein
MDKIYKITQNRKTSDLAIDGLVYGLVSGILMLVSLGVLFIISGENLSVLLARFSPDNLATPLQGLLSHMAISAIYGILFGVLCWPLLARYAPGKIIALLVGLAYGALLLLLSQTAILPNTGSALSQLPFWQWALGHEVYGLALSGLFLRKLS